MVLLLAAVTLVMIFEIRRALDPATSQKPEPVLPEKLRSRERIAELPTEQQPVTRESFDARIAQGLEVREIRWIIEDFMNSGLDQSLSGGPPELYLARRSAQHRWLLDTLVQGLGLNSSQREQAWAAMEAQMESAEEQLGRIIEAGQSVEVNGILYQLINGGDLAQVVDPQVWMEAEAYLPGNLCDLNPGQAEVARKGEAEGDPVFLELLPITAEQAEALDARAPDLLNQATLLHPAQLRTLLLLSPELAAALSQLADAAE